MVNYAERLYELRTEKGLSQKEAANDLGVSQALLSHYEKGIREFGLDFLNRAADYYKVTTDYILGRTRIHSFVNKYCSTVYSCGIIYTIFFSVLEER